MEATTWKGVGVDRCRRPLADGTDHIDIRTCTTAPCNSDGPNKRSK